MDNNQYRRARGLAWKLASSHGFANEYPDLVHDAYISWYNKTKSDLFDEHPGTIFHVIKNICMARSVLNRFRYRHQTHSRTRVTIPSTDKPEEGSSFYIPYTLPTDNLVAEEIASKIEAVLKPKELITYYYLLQGYKPSEIAELERGYRQKINGRVTKIRNKATKILSEL